MDKSIKDYDVKSGKIVLRSVFGKIIKYVIQPTRDDRGRWPECVKPVNKDGDIILTEKEREEENHGIKHYIPQNATFTVQDGTEFDLSDIYQAAEWAAIENCSIIAPSRMAKGKDGKYLIDGDVTNNTGTARYGRAELYIEVPGLITQKKVDRVKKKHEAVSLILNDPRGTDGLRLRAKLIGRNLDNQPTSDVEDYLLQIAEKDPDKIISIYNEENVGYRVLFTEAKDKKVIIYKDRSFWYGDIQLSGTDEGVITWMKQPCNANTLQMIRNEVYPELEGTGKSTLTKKK